LRSSQVPGGANIPVRIEIEVSEIGPALKEIEEAVERAVEKAVNDFADLVLARSQVYVPVDTGQLKKSGNIARESGEVRVSYQTDYAVYVHEDETKFHNPPTRAKYLSLALEESLPEFDGLLDGALESELSKLG